MAKEHVHDVFESVAEQYDAANDRISLGMHHRWKDCLIKAVKPAFVGSSARRRALDVCCGTGDITRLIAAAHPGVEVTGLDFSAGMLDVARRRTVGLGNVILVEGNALELPFEDDAFDTAVISFGLRNTPDYDQVVSEMARVTRPGGIVACLDASVPDNSVVYPFYNVYYKQVMPLLGGGRSKKREYDWLYQSTREFLHKDELRELFERCGLAEVKVKSFMMGAAALHVGVVPAE